jgi:hypothetical protein
MREKNGKNHHFVSAPANIATANMTKILALDFIGVDIQFLPRFCFLLQHSQHVACCAAMHRVSLIITDILLRPACKTPQKSRKPQFEYFGTEKWFKCAGYPTPITIGLGPKVAMMITTFGTDIRFLLLMFPRPPKTVN